MKTYEIEIKDGRGGALGGHPRIVKIEAKDRAEALRKAKAQAEKGARVTVLGEA